MLANIAMPLSEAVFAVDDVSTLYDDVDEMPVDVVEAEEVVEPVAEPKWLKNLFDLSVPNDMVFSPEESDAERIADDVELAVKNADLIRPRRMPYNVDLDASDESEGDIILSDGDDDDDDASRSGKIYLIPHHHHHRHRHRGEEGRPSGSAPCPSCGANHPNCSRLRRSSRAETSATSS